MAASQPSAADRFTSIDAVRLALGYLYVHFGVLKFFPDLSPAEVIASYTTLKLLGFQMGADGALFWVAVMECIIGVGLLLKMWMRLAGTLFLLHMAGTLMPLFILPEFTFKFFPFAPTTEGQYILKNLVLIAAGWSVVGPHFRRTAPAQADLPTGDNTQPAQA
jgi:uncharacterized membrane protein YphA (DoxX/SURF4 family)